MSFPTVRVHLLTYRRHQLLPRALDSLRAQTFRHWICELHNDDPADQFPGQLASACADSRIHVVHHSKNLGTVESFNEVFRPVPETYIAVLEDDNAWDPNFLEVMVDALEQNPAVAAGWANQRFWCEQRDGSWTEEGSCVVPARPGEGPRLCYWPSVRQVVGAIHSNSATLWRTALCHVLKTPSQVSSSCLEAFRERATPQPMLCVPAPLGHYAVTLQTTRSRDTWRYVRDQVALAGSFFAVVARQGQPLHAALHSLRDGGAYAGHIILLAALALPGCGFLLRHATWRDWFYLFRFAVRRPIQTRRLLWSPDGAAPLFHWLVPHTQQRLAEARAFGFDEKLQQEWLTPCSPVVKSA